MLGAYNFDNSIAGQTFEVTLNDTGLTYVNNATSTVVFGGSAVGEIFAASNYYSNATLTLNRYKAAGAVTEDLNVSSGQLNAAGRLAVSDADPGEAKFSTAVTSAFGNLGSLSITEDGTWSYSAFNSGVQYLGAGVQKTETFTVKSFDGTASQNMSVTIRGVNDAPTVGSFNIIFGEDRTFAFNTFTPNLFTQYFNDIDGNSLSKIKILSLPANGVLKLGNSVVTINQEIAAANLGDLSFTPSADFHGTVSFSWNASDGTTYAATPAVVNLIISPQNDVPTVTNPITDQSASEDSLFAFTIPVDTFSDVDAGGRLTYTATLEDGNLLPAWLSFDADTRTFSGTPENHNVGNLSVKVTAIDGSGATASDTFTLTIANTNDAPFVASPIAEPSATEEVPFSFTLPAEAFADLDGDELTYTVSLLDDSPLPSWLTFDPTTRTFSGTPDGADLAGLFIKVTVTDPSGASTYNAFQVTVNPTDDLTVITAPIQQIINEDNSLIFGSATGNAITLTDVDADDSLLQVSLLVSSSDLGGGISLGDTSGLTYVSEDSKFFKGTLAAINAALEGLTFYPSSDGNGTANLQVMVSNPDTLESNSQTISIQVNPVNDAPNLYLGIAPTVNEDEPFSFSFSPASDPDDGFYVGVT